MSTIKWSLDVEVSNGPKTSVSRNITVSAYDKIDVAVNDGATVTVAVQPSVVADVQFLLITSDRYGASLTYEVAGSAVGAIALDAPQLFVGAGALGLLGADPQNLEFVNNLGLGNDASIQIIVGRNVP